MPDLMDQPTSDIGMMYRQYLQQKGMPLTNANMQSVIAQSQREPGMIAGLTAAPSSNPTMPGIAEAPPNVAGASPNSSGAPLPMPSAQAPRGMPLSPIPPQQPPSMPMPTTMGGGTNVPTPGPIAPGQSPTQQPPPSQPPMNTGGAQAATPTVGMPNQFVTPPPGQAPEPQQSSAEAFMQNALPYLGTAGAVGLLKYLGPKAPPAVAQPTPGVGPRVANLPEVGPGAAAQPPLPSEAPSAKSVAGAVNSGKSAPSMADNVALESGRGAPPPAKAPPAKTSATPAPTQTPPDLKSSVDLEIGHSAPSLSSVIEKAVNPKDASLENYVNQKPQAPTSPDAAQRMIDRVGGGHEMDRLFSNDSTRQPMVNPSPTPEGTKPFTVRAPAKPPTGDAVRIPEQPLDAKTIANNVMHGPPPPQGPRPEPMTAQGGPTPAPQTRPTVVPEPLGHTQGPPELVTVHEAPRQIVPDLPWMNSKLNMHGLKRMPSFRP